MELDNHGDKQRMECWATISKLQVTLIFCYNMKSINWPIQKILGTDSSEDEDDSAVKIKSIQDNGRQKKRVQQMFETIGL